MTCIFCGSTQHDYRSCTFSATVRQRPIALKQEFSGKSPNVFIGRHGYPHVRVGILGTEQYEGNDEPEAWSAQGTPIGEIARLRAALINSYAPGDVRSMATGMAQLSSSVGLARRPVDVEVRLKEVPRLRLSTDKDTLPHGPSVPISTGAVVENVPIDTRVERAHLAGDLRAADAVNDLLSSGVSPYYLTKAFSIGGFGLPMERKLVPTRWSITAVDDIAGKRLLTSVRDHPVSDCLVYSGGHLGNYYIILLFDDVWQYELVEWHPASDQRWTDEETFAGRTTYAKETAGGYYAARIGILDTLHAARRQASVLAIRIITDEYTTPLGVWVVREAVRKALAEPPVRCADRTLAVAYAASLLKGKFGVTGEDIFTASTVLARLRGQTKLTRYT